MPEPDATNDHATIDHVGVAVHSLEGAESLFRALLDGGPAGREEVPDEGVRVSFFGRGTGRLELLEPTETGSSVARFLERRGPGVHHVCLRVEDLDRSLERAREAGAEVVPPGVREGAGGRRVAFLHPRSTGGILLELAEATGDEERGGGEGPSG